jgi:alpha-ketoglutarate-dependent taurine dioxygenase
MPSLTALDTLRRAAATSPTSFLDLPTEPVEVADAWQVRPAVPRIVRRYRAHGFAVVRFAAEPWTERAVEELAAALDLGEPFVPPLYTRGDYASSRVSRIGTSPATDRPASHPHFETTVGQDLHCDGTLQDIGVVRAAVLLCQSPGAEGGETTVFNAHAAFTALLAADPAAAQALTQPGVLVRRATFNDSDEVNEGPAVAVIEDRLVCRYCVDVTDEWASPAGSDPTALARGLEFLAAASRDGSEYTHQLTLAAGHALLLDNTRVSHGRRPYRDGPGRRRCLFRSLHLRHPDDRTAA